MYLLSISYNIFISRPLTEDPSTYPCPFEVSRPLILRLSSVCLCSAGEHVCFSHRVAADGSISLDTDVRVGTLSFLLHTQKHTMYSYIMVTPPRLLTARQPPL